MQLKPLFLSLSEHNVTSPLWASERLSTTTASDNETSDKPDNLRVESRPSLSRYLDEVHRLLL